MIKNKDPIKKIDIEGLDFKIFKSGIKKNDADLVAALVAFDREEKNAEGKSYKSSLSDEGIAIYSVASFSDLEL